MYQLPYWCNGMLLMYQVLEKYSGFVFPRAWNPQSTFFQYVLSKKTMLSSPKINLAPDPFFAEEN